MVAGISPKPRYFIDIVTPTISIILRLLPTLSRVFPLHLGRESIAFGVRTDCHRPLYCIDRILVIRILFILIDYIVRLEAFFDAALIAINNTIVPAHALIG